MAAVALGASFYALYLALRDKKDDYLEPDDKRRLDQLWRERNAAMPRRFKPGQAVAQRSSMGMYGAARVVGYDEQGRFYVDWPYSQVRFDNDSGWEAVDESEGKA